MNDKDDNYTIDKPEDLKDYPSNYLGSPYSFITLLTMRRYDYVELGYSESESKQ